MRLLTPALSERMKSTCLTLLLCATIAVSPQSIAQDQPTQKSEIPHSWQALLDNLESMSKPLGENSKDYIDCLEQQPALQNNPEDIAALLEEIGSMSKTCQFLLDDLLRQYQQIINKQSFPADKNSI